MVTPEHAHDDGFDDVGLDLNASRCLKMWRAVAFGATLCRVLCTLQPAKQGQMVRK